MRTLDVNRWGAGSLARLSTCDQRLVDLFKLVIRVLPPGHDATVLWGHRGESEQNAAFESGASKVQWPRSSHNANPSLAVDVWPYPLPSTASGWSAPEYIALCWYQRGLVEAVARETGCELRPVISWDPCHFAVRARSAAPSELREHGGSIR